MIISASHQFWATNLNIHQTQVTWAIHDVCWPANPQLQYNNQICKSLLLSRFSYEKSSMLNYLQLNSHSMDNWRSHSPSACAFALSFLQISITPYYSQANRHNLQSPAGLLRILRLHSIYLKVYLRQLFRIVKV